MRAFVQTHIHTCMQLYKLLPSVSMFEYFRGKMNESMSSKIAYLSGGCQVTAPLRASPVNR